MTDDFGALVEVEGSDGFNVMSNNESSESIEASMNDFKVNDLKDEIESTDGDRGRGKDGKFVTVKPIPPEKLNAAPEPEKDDIPEEPVVEDDKPDDKPEEEPKEAAAEDAEAEEEPKEARDSKAKQRIHEVIEQRREVEAALRAERADRARERAELDELRRSVRPAPPVPQADGNGGAPKESDYADYSDYVRESTRYETRTMLQAVIAEAQKHEGARTYTENVRGAIAPYSEALQAAGGPEFIKTLPPHIASIEPSFRVEDDGTIVRRPDNEVGPLNILADEIIKSGPQAPAILKYLSANDDVFRRLSSAANPEAIYRELGKIEALTAVTPGTPAPSVPQYKPKANPPVKPVTGSPNMHDDDGSINDEISFEEHIRRENARQLKRRQARG